MRHNPERLAWAVLLISFSVLLTLLVAVPLGIRAYILRAQVKQSVTLEVQRGPLRATMAGQGVPVAVAENYDEIPEGTVVATDSTSGQLVMHVPAADRPVIARVQIYDNTEVELSSARSPRFSPSHLPHRVVIAVRAGRVRISVSNDDARPAVVEVNTPHGASSLVAGSYEVKVSGNRMEVTVRDGEASVSYSVEQVMLVGPAERAIVENEQITGPLPGARNLVANGNFQDRLDTAWSTYQAQTDPEQSPPRATIATDQGRELVDFYRNSSNHAEVGIAQEIDYDVRDFTFLELHVAVRVHSQDIAGFGGCGYLSSECPIIISLQYKDTLGSDREWLHGFYTGEPADGWPLHPWTERIPLGTWHTYDSGNLMEELGDTPPAIIKDLTVYASGHRFHAQVTEVELLAQE